MQCLKCQYANASNAKFCNQCAAPFAPVCSACGHTNTAEAKLCNQCGTPLIAPPSAANLSQPVQRELPVANRFHALIPVVIMLLQREGRLTYRTLQWTFNIDDTLLEEMRKELSA